MTTPKRRRLPLAGLGLIGAGGVLGVTLGMPGAAYAEPGAEVARSSEPRSAESGSRSAESGASGESVQTGTALLRARLEGAVAERRLTRDQAATILQTAEAGLLNGDLLGGPGGPAPAADRQTGR